MKGRPEDFSGRGNARVLLGCCVQTQEHPWEVAVPRQPGFPGTQGVLYLPVNTFHHSVSLWVESSGEVVLDPQLLDMQAHVAEVNCVPLSVVTVAGTSKCATHPATNCSAQVVAQCF
jgi:hypothetical protein